MSVGSWLCKTYQADKTKRAWFYEGRECPLRLRRLVHACPFLLFAMAILYKPSQWQEPFSVTTASVEDSHPPSTHTPHAVCWEDEVRTDPKSLTYPISSAWMCVCGPALWLCARIKPMEQLCELSWVRALHVKLSPRQRPALPLPVCSHYTSCGHEGLPLLEKSN